MFRPIMVDISLAKEEYVPVAMQFVEVLLHIPFCFRTMQRNDRSMKVNKYLCLWAYELRMGFAAEDFQAIAATMDLLCSLFQNAL